MSIFISIWHVWAGLFSSIPNGDPWVASFAGVGVLMVTAHALKKLVASF